MDSESHLLCDTFSRHLSIFFIILMTPLGLADKAKDDDTLE